MIFFIWGFLSLFCTAATRSIWGCLLRQHCSAKVALTTADHFSREQFRVTASRLGYSSDCPGECTDSPLCSGAPVPSRGAGGEFL